MILFQNGISFQFRKLYLKTYWNKNYQFEIFIRNNYLDPLKTFRLPFTLFRRHFCVAETLQQRLN